MSLRDRSEIMVKVEVDLDEAIVLERHITHLMSVAVEHKISEIEEHGHENWEKQYGKVYNKLAELELKLKSAIAEATQS